MRWACVAMCCALFGCSSSKSGCDASGCPSGQFCIASNRCATSCGGIDPDAGAPCLAGESCGTSGPFCEPNSECPALAFQACLFPDGG